MKTSFRSLIILGAVAVAAVALASAQSVESGGFQYFPAIRLTNSGSSFKTFSLGPAGSEQAYFEGDGDLYLSTRGSSTTTPRKFGMTDFNTGLAARWYFGDDYTGVQNAFSYRMQIYAFHGIEIWGGRDTSASPAFTLGGSGSDVSLTVKKSASNTTAITADGAIESTATGFKYPDGNTQSKVSRLLWMPTKFGQLTSSSVFVGAWQPQAAARLERIYCSWDSAGVVGGGSSTNVTLKVRNTTAGSDTCSITLGPCDTAAGTGISAAIDGCDGTTLAASTEYRLEVVSAGGCAEPPQNAVCTLSAKAQ